MGVQKKCLQIKGYANNNTVNCKHLFTQVRSLIDRAPLVPIFWYALVIYSQCNLNHSVYISAPLGE